MHSHHLLYPAIVHVLCHGLVPLSGTLTLLRRLAIPSRPHLLDALADVRHCHLFQHTGSGIQRFQRGLGFSGFKARGPGFRNASFRGVVRGSGYPRPGIPLNPKPRGAWFRASSTRGKGSPRPSRCPLRRTRNHPGPRSTGTRPGSAARPRQPAWGLGFKGDAGFFSEASATCLGFQGFQGLGLGADLLPRVQVIEPDPPVRRRDH